MGWVLEVSKQFAAVTLVVGVPTAAITYLFPKSEISVVGGVGRTVLKYTPYPFSRTDGFNAISAIDVRKSSEEISGRRPKCAQDMNNVTNVTPKMTEKDLISQANEYQRSAGAHIQTQGCDIK